MNPAFAEWIKTRPQTVQDLAAEFPPGMSLSFDGRTLYVVGWTELGFVIISDVHPSDDYDRSYERRRMSHADCLRDAIKPS